MVYWNTASSLCKVNISDKTLNLNKSEKELESYFESYLSNYKSKMS